LASVSARIQPSRFLSSIILTAFCLEAFLNHVGPTVLSSLDRLERVSWRAKLDLLCELLKVDIPNENERPLKTISTLFRFRNTLAHGRTVMLEPAEKRLDPEEVDAYLQQRLLRDWEKLIEDASFARRAREDVEAVVMAIHAVRNCVDSACLTHSKRKLCPERCAHPCPKRRDQADNADTTEKFSKRTIASNRFRTLRCWCAPVSPLLGSYKSALTFPNRITRR
jgi:hypothetical protein